MYKEKWGSLFVSATVHHELFLYFKRDKYMFRRKAEKESVKESTESAIEKNKFNQWKLIK